MATHETGTSYSDFRSGVVEPGTLLLTCKPFVYVGRLDSPQILCDTCLIMQADVNDQLRKCSSCHTVWYCNRTCQKKGWKDGHKYECKRMELLSAFPKGPDCQKFAWVIRLVLRIMVKLQDGNDYYEELEIGGTIIKRRFSDLISNYEMLCRNEGHRDAFKLITQFAKLLLGTDMDIKIPDDIELFKICCRVSTNTFEIANNGNYRVGSGLYIASSVFSHSCNFMAVRTFEGATMNVRNIRAIPKSFAIDQLTVTYTSTLAPSPERRKLLQSSWYFLCKCERCVSGQFDKEMRSIICGCKAEIDTEEMKNPCSACGNVMKEEVVARIREAEKSALQLRNIRADLQTIETCIRKLKKCNFSNTHWLMITLLEKAYGAAERICKVTHKSSDIRKTYTYGSKYVIAAKRYLHPNDIELLRTLMELSHLAVLLNLMDEAEKHTLEAKSIAEVVHGKNSRYIQKRIDPFLEKYSLMSLMRGKK